MGARALAAVAGRREVLLDVANFLQLELVVEVADRRLVQRVVVNKGDFVKIQGAVRGYRAVGSEELVPEEVSVAAANPRRGTGRLADDADLVNPVMGP